MAFIETVKDDLSVGYKWLANELVKKANGEALFAEKLDKFTINEVINYCVIQARDMAAGRTSIMVDDQTVLGWAIHCIDEEIKQKELSQNIAPIKTPKRVESNPRSTIKTRAVSKEKMAVSPVKEKVLSIFDFGVSLDEEEQDDEQDGAE